MYINLNYILTNEKPEEYLGNAHDALLELITISPKDLQEKIKEIEEVLPSMEDIEDETDEND